MTRIVRRIGLAAALVVGASLFLLVPAAGAQTNPGCGGYGPCGPTITLNQFTYTVGQTATATLNTYVANENVTITFNSTPITLGTVKVDGTGHATFTFTIPNVPVGNHTVVGTGATGDTASTGLQVINGGVGGNTGNNGTGNNGVSGTPPTQTGGTSGTVAFTGADIWPLTLVGGLAILLGGLAVLATRKRTARQ